MKTDCKTAFARMFPALFVALCCRQAAATQPTDFSDRYRATLDFSEQPKGYEWSTGPQDKDHEQPYLLSPSTSILDDYFFIHREVLVWRFLAATCKQEKGQIQCPIKQRAQFGTLDPRQHSSAPLTAEYLGREKINFKGSPQEFNRVEFKTDVGNWQLWLDDQFKVMRIVIEGDNTEVVRD